MNKYKETIYELLDLFVYKIANHILHSKGLNKDDLKEESTFHRIGWKRLSEDLYDRLEELMNIWFDDEEYMLANDLLGILEDR